MIPEMPAAEPATEPAEKLSHAEVHYGLAKPNGDKCATCGHYIAKNNCQLVEPPIYPAGWCSRFESKAEEGAEQAQGIDTPAEEVAEAKPDTLAHGRAIAGAKALHAVGHISPEERDKHMKASRAALKKAKPRKAFWSWAP